MTETAAWPISCCRRRPSWSMTISTPPAATPSCRSTRKVVEPYARGAPQPLCHLRAGAGAWAREHPGFHMTEWELIDETLKALRLARCRRRSIAGHWHDCALHFESGAFPRRLRPSRRQVPLQAGLGGASAPATRALPALPDHAPIIDAADAEHPFRLVAAPARQFLNSTFTETPGSQAREGRPTVLIHPDGLRARSASPRATACGSATGRARSSSMRGRSTGCSRGVVVIESIWPNSAFEEGIGVNALTSADAGPPNGGAVFHDTAVWVRAGVTVALRRRRPPQAAYHRPRQREGRVGQVDHGHASDRGPAARRPSRRQHRSRRPPGDAHPLRREPQGDGARRCCRCRCSRHIPIERSSAGSARHGGAPRIGAGFDRGAGRAWRLRLHRHRYAGQRHRPLAPRPCPCRHPGHAAERQLPRSRPAGPARSRRPEDPEAPASMPRWSGSSASAGRIGRRRLDRLDRHAQPPLPASMPATSATSAGCWSSCPSASASASRPASPSA